MTSRRSLAATGVAALAAVAVGGCGGDRATGTRSTGATTPATTRAAETTPPGSIPLARARRPPARGTLLLLKRVVSADPVSSQLMIDRDGWATARLTLGGPAGQIAYDFRLTRAQLRSVSALVRAARLRDTDWGDPHHYIYWLTTAGRSWRFEQIELTPSMRPLVRRLNYLLDLHTDSLTGRSS